MDDVVRAEYPAERFAGLKAARPDLAAEAFEAVETKAGELTVVSFDGRPVHLLGPWTTRVFWKVANRVDVERIDVASDPKVDPRHLKMVACQGNAYLTEVVVNELVNKVVEAERLIPDQSGVGTPCHISFTKLR